MEYFYTLPQAASCIGCHKDTIYDWIEKGKIKANKAGCFYKINSKEVHRMAVLLKHNGMNNV